MNEILVELGERTYPVRIGFDTLSSFGEVCRSFSLPDSVVVLTDSNVSRLHGRQLLNSLRHAGFSVLSLVIPPGEHQKTLRRANSIITRLLKNGMSRRAAMIAFGGGVIGDLAGFVAATFRRGIPLVQCPTTLLSQVDSSIGGKVGVNHPLAKNVIGAFYQPKFVFTDLNLLRTLPKRQVISGMGEIMKYGIVGGEEFFQYLGANLHNLQSLDADTVMETARRCISLKAALVSEDERELRSDGGRQVLNVGHAVGQALETLSNYQLHHGEAVLLGLRIETAVAKDMGFLSTDDAERIQTLLSRMDVRAPFRRIRKKTKPPFKTERLIKTLAKSRFVLPAAIGKVHIMDEVPEAILRIAVETHLLDVAR